MEILLLAAPLPRATERRGFCNVEDCKDKARCVVRTGEDILSQWGIHTITRFNRNINHPLADRITVVIMFSLSSTHQYYLYRGTTDMRKSFDGLCGIVQSQLQRSVMSGEVFIFMNHRRDRVKLLHWEPGGFVLYYKRLESGTFEMPQYDQHGNCFRIEWSQLVMMVDGIRLKGIEKRRRFATPG